jgi:hypothetical protein
MITEIQQVLILLGCAVAAAALIIIRDQHHP